MPRSFVRRISDRYIAGTTIADAVQVVRELNAGGKMATVDVLGEEADSAQARAEHEVRDCSCQRLSPVDRLLILRPAGGHVKTPPIKVRTACGGAHYFAYRELRAEGHENVGLVLQAALRRSIRDIHDLAPLQPNVRLVKGIYIEPPLIAYQEYEEVRENFVRCLHELLQAGSYTAIATHDEQLLTEGKRLVAERGLALEQYEFQMLLGVREIAAGKLVRDGHRLRIYVPFGEHWYSYSLRRLQENPKIAGYVASDTMSRLFGADGR